ncbi:MAG: SDR family NAD(P)-dependent oxidoreductase [Flavobacteriales bacterium]|nr:SDR family NAD(P)-dependent oxidoreductase [Flavobacteriales bacterium]
MELRDRTAVVSGAGSGLGRALAEALVSKGATVHGLGRTEKKLLDLKVELGDQFVPAVLDIADEQAVRAWVERTFIGDASPDILINNAGAGYFAKIDELPSERWREMIDTNLNGLFHLTSAIVPHMKRKAGPAHIINIGSILGKVGGAERSGYSATKFAVQGFSESLARELRYNGIKVTCVNPGSISTHFFERSGIEAHDNMLHPDDVAQLIIHLLETPDNLLVDEITLRPLQPGRPQAH